MSQMALRMVALLAFGLVILLVLSVPLRAEAQQRIQTEAIECFAWNAGDHDVRTSPAFDVGGVEYRLRVSVERVKNTPYDDDDCRVRYDLLTAAQGASSLTTRELWSGALEGGAAAEFVGLSPDRKLLAADLYSYAGDYIEHRPMVLDLRTGKVMVRDVDDRIRDRLPPCDYAVIFDGITDNAEAEFHVPKSDYADEGCPAQGEWSLDMKSDRLRRVPRARSEAGARSQATGQSKASERSGAAKKR
jgi:hypothetical protein